MSEALPKLLAEWFWTDRWMGSSAFGLPIEARGLYREMLTQAWRRECRLPNDHEAIQRIVGCTKPEWRRCWPKIERYWLVDGSSLVNATQVEVYGRAMAGALKASDRARDAAHARWQRKHSSGNAQALLVQCPPSLSPSHEEQDQNKPAPKPRRAVHAVEKSNAAEEPSPDRDAPALRDCPVSAPVRSDDRRLRVEGADEAAPVEAGLRIPEPAADGLGPRRSGAGDAEVCRAAAGATPATAGAEAAAAARPSVAGTQAGGMGGGRSDAGRQVSGWSRIGAA